MAKIGNSNISLKNKLMMDKTVEVWRQEYNREIKERKKNL